MLQPDAFPVNQSVEKEFGMRKAIVAGGMILLLGLCALADNPSQRRVPQPAKLFLRKGWSIQSSAQVKEKGDAISANSFQPKNWYPATVPSTIVGNLVEDKVYPDPLVDKNLRLMPGCSYPVGANFSNLPMPEDSPFEFPGGIALSFAFRQTTAVRMSG